MIGAPVSVFDIIVIAVFSISTLIAFFRGFIRELLSLGAWVGAAVITIYLFPHSTDFMKQHVKNEHVASGVGALGTFIAAVIGISILNSIIMRYVKAGNEVGILDNFLGLIFGAIRGAFVLSLGFLMMTAFIPKEPQPDWLKTSFSKDWLQKGADMLVSVAPKYINEVEAVAKKEEEKLKEDAGDKGYKPENQKEFDRLIDSNQPQSPSQGMNLYHGR